MEKEKKINIQDYIVDVHDLLSNAVGRLCKNEHKGVVITDGETVVGVFTRADLLRCSHCFGMQDVKVNAFMETDFDYCINTLDPKYHDSKHTIVPILTPEHALIDVYFPPEKRNEVPYKYPVVINAGGKGTRLYPYTRLLPKPLIPVVNNKPMVELIMNRFHKFGCQNFHMIVNYKRELVKEYFTDVKHPYDVHFYDEDAPLGTGGGLYFLKDIIDKHFFFSNCDVLMLEDFDTAYEYHLLTRNIATMIVSLKPIYVPYGVIKTDISQNIMSIIEKPTYVTLINTGIYILRPDIFKYINSNENIGFPDVLERAEKDGHKVGVYPITADKWLDMGEIGELEHARAVLTEVVESEDL